MFDDIIIQMFSLSFNFLGIKIDMNNIIQTVTSFGDFSSMKETDVWGLASQLHTLMIPIALSLLTLFTIIKLVKETMEINRLTWERVVMIAVEMFIYKFFIDNSFTFLSTIMSITSDIFTSAMQILGATASISSLGEALAELCSGGVFTQVMLFLLIFIMWIALLGTTIGVTVQIVLVFVKTVLGFSVSPIPISCGQLDGNGSNTTKTFFMWIASLGLEYTLIAICVKIYNLGLGSITFTTDMSIGVALGTMAGVLFANSLLMASVSYCSQLAEKVLGGR